MNEHRFELKAEWTGGLDGTGNIRAGNLVTAISVPSQLDGPGIGTNPEEMLLGAAGTCYLITLSILLKRLGITTIELNSEIFVQSSPAMKVDKIIHRPRISVPIHTLQEELDKISKAAYRAEQTCMISKALKGNVEVTVEPEISLVQE
ncbi:peroxiredoxin, SACOL1771 subfamily [Paenibacillus sp. yr247]|uniref:OsmC family protein n=1 Tax=Paenibacillus sp. yr247 TaxID=1761880 RepID=UPI0008909FEF|nr:OsmC family protein [Paenibacillus sp. yr247]SDN53645.1 peroxiredoxin, SACOL1771 subfamily [Paenibacillus sp. yr247]